MDKPTFFRASELVKLAGGNKYIVLETTNLLGYTMIYNLFPNPRSLVQIVVVKNLCRHNNEFDEEGFAEVSWDSGQYFNSSFGETGLYDRAKKYIQDKEKGFWGVVLE